MRAPLSIVIPTLNAGPALPGLFAALVEGLEAGLIREVVICDGGSGDETCALAEAAGARLLHAPPGRGGQIRRAVAAAGGDWLMVLHADSWPEPGWAEAVARAMQDPARAHVFRLRFRARGPAARLTVGWANLRTRAFGLPYGDQGLVIARGLLREVGGYPDLPLMEDVALARALAGRVALMEHMISTDAGRFVARGWLRAGAGNLWRLARFMAGADPARLARGYRR